MLGLGLIYISKRSPGVNNAVRLQFMSVSGVHADSNFHGKVRNVEKMADPFTNLV